ncbi:MAG: hypothetical protein DMF61_17070 [Blastocatellia bacterium AA13]|nr:MAG: hypothetical protein DMF61_17070 [Blastocatellia bacterium AA13]
MENKIRRGMAERKRFGLKNWLLAVVVLAIISGTSIGRADKKGGNMKIEKITAVLFGEEIEPCVNFWVERFGFTREIEVPDGDKLAFAALRKGNTELMYQSYKSADRDEPALSSIVRKGPTFLYIDVDNLDETISALKGVEVVMPVRTTFYGSKEIGVKDPAGHFVTFSQQAAAKQ